MVALIVTYYVFVYDPVVSLRYHDGGDLDSMPDGRHREANPIDSGIFGSTRAFLGRWYTTRLPIAERDRLEQAFNKVRIHCRDF